MIISAWIVQRPRKVRKCCDCGKLIDGPQLRLYGYAETGDKPYPVWLHPECDKDPEVKKKLAAQVTRAKDGEHV